MCNICLGKLLYDMLGSRKFEVKYKENKIEKNKNKVKLVKSAKV